MRRYQVEVGGRTHVVDVQEISGQQFRVVVEGRELEVTLSAAEDVSDAIASPEIAPARGGNGSALGEAPSAARFRPPAPETLPPMVKAAPPPLPSQPGQGPRAAVTAPMPGTVVSVETKAGDSVKAGQVLLKLEAMKMVNAIKAPHDGVLAEVRVQPGQSVGYGHVLVTFKEA